MFSEDGLGLGIRPLLFPRQGPDSQTCFTHVLPEWSPGLALADTILGQATARTLSDPMVPQAGKGA